MEIVFAITFLGVAMVGILGLITQSMITMASAKQKTQASFLAQEAMEIAHNIRDTNYKKNLYPFDKNFYDQTGKNGWYQLKNYDSANGAGWELAFKQATEADDGTTLSLDGKEFKRYIYVTKNINGTDETDKRLITVTVKWDKGKVESSTVLTNWYNYPYSIGVGISPASAEGELNPATYSVNLNASILAGSEKNVIGSPTWYFYCDRSDAGIDIGGATPNAGGSAKTCTYSSVGTFTAKVIVTKQSVTGETAYAEARATIKVNAYTPPPTLDCIGVTKNAVTLRYTSPNIATITRSIAVPASIVTLTSNLAAASSGTNYIDSNSVTPATGYTYLISDNISGKSDSEFCVTQGNIAVGTGSYHSAVLKNNGTVWTTGHNDWREDALGLGLTTDESKYFWTQIQTDIDGNAFNNVVSISVGNGYVLALKSDGTVWAWGRNENGQLGNGEDAAMFGWTWNPEPKPLKALTAAGVQLTNIVAIAAGESHSMALKRDGTVWVVGQNDNGKLGLGTVGGKKLYWTQTTLTNVKAISAGSQHSLALKNDGSVMGAGSTAGLGTAASLVIGVTPSTQPNWTTVIASGITAISAGQEHSMAVKTDTTVLVTGLNEHWELGIATGGGYKNTWVSPINSIDGTTFSGAKEISASVWGSMVVKTNGEIWVAGSNEYWRWGTLSGSSVGGFTKSTNASGISQIGNTAGRHTVATTTGSRVLSSGMNTYGQLGICNGSCEPHDWYWGRIDVWLGWNDPYAYALLDLAS